MVNWKVRIKNKNFWIGLIPAILVLVKETMAIFGWYVDMTQVSGRIVNAIEALFVVLAIVGIVNDPTTEGFSDSYRAMGYDKPYEKAK